MNINGFPSQVSSARPLGGQLDITLNGASKPQNIALNGVSKPQNIARAESVQLQSQVGTIANVLSDDENLALASMFQSSGQSLYTISGNTQTTRAMPGSRLDVQA